MMIALNRFDSGSTFTFRNTYTEYGKTITMVHVVYPDHTCIIRCAIQRNTGRETNFRSQVYVALGWGCHQDNPPVVFCRCQATLKMLKWFALQQCENRFSRRLGLMSNFNMLKSFATYFPVLKITQVASMILPQYRKYLRPKLIAYKVTWHMILHYYTSLPR